MIRYIQYMNELHEALLGAQASGADGRTFELDAGLERFAALTLEARRRGGGLFFIGNGASAMMAGHMAADAEKNAGFKTWAFNDAALLTAIANDLSFEDVFALPIRRHAGADDVLVAISSSGNSKNILAAIEAMREKGGRVVSLTGMHPDNRARVLGDLNLYVPAQSYGLIEAAHQAILHAWMDRTVEAG
ncbi:MAG: SIS domain-containing protein [Myxococcales bacterium]|nr:MAG: SIS domain-containing protein [Myxococcales bacterium]